MKKIPLPRAQFTKIITNTPPQTHFVTIYKDKRFCMNSKLAAILAEKPLEIAFTEDGKHFMLAESSNSTDGLRFSKSGSKKLHAAVELLDQLHIMLPARYEVWHTDDGFWQGDLLENPTQSQSKKPPSSKKH